MTRVFQYIPQKSLDEHWEETNPIPKWSRDEWGNCRHASYSISKDGEFCNVCGEDITEELKEERANDYE
jgi:formamidopyrimidine-DNA glycosylase